MAVAPFADFGWSAVNVTQFDNRGRMVKLFEPHNFSGIYDPTLGRFMTPDPFVEWSGNPQRGHGRY